MSKRMRVLPKCLCSLVVIAVFFVAGCHNSPGVPAARFQQLRPGVAPAQVTQTMKAPGHLVCRSQFANELLEIRRFWADGRYTEYYLVFRDGGLVGVMPEQNWQAVWVFIEKKHGYPLCTIGALPHVGGEELLRSRSVAGARPMSSIDFSAVNDARRRSYEQVEGMAWALAWWNPVVMHEFYANGPNAWWRETNEWFAKLDALELNMSQEAVTERFGRPFAEVPMNDGVTYLVFQRKPGQVYPENQFTIAFRNGLLRAVYFGYDVRDEMKIGSEQGGHQTLEGPTNSDGVD